MSKTPEMERCLDAFSEAMFGRKRSESMSRNVCVTCGGEVGRFRDNLSLKEHGISGMCQECQDSVFGGSNGEES